MDVDDKTPWQEACAKVIKDNTSDQAELYQKLLDKMCIRDSLRDLSRSAAG